MPRFRVDTFVLAVAAHVFIHLAIQALMPVTHHGTCLADITPQPKMNLLAGVIVEHFAFCAKVLFITNSAFESQLLIVQLYLAFNTM